VDCFSFNRSVRQKNRFGYGKLRSINKKYNNLDVLLILLFLGYNPDSSFANCLWVVNALSSKSSNLSEEDVSTFIDEPFCVVISISNSSSYSSYSSPVDDDAALVLRSSVSAISIKKFIKYII
jgi:hypothetical protein